MKILGFNISLTRSAPQPPQPPAAPRSLSPEAIAWLHGSEPGPVSHLSNAYEQVVWVYRAANILAEQVANIPFVFSRGERGREHLITSGPLHTFYNQPAPQLNRFQYWELRVLWLLLQGECFRIPVYEDSSGITSLGKAQRQSRLKSVLILNPTAFQHVVVEGRLQGWRYTNAHPDSSIPSQIFLPEEVWFERLPSPFDPWRGFPPLFAAARPAKADFTAAAFMQDILERNADNGLIVRTDQQFTQEQRDQVSAELRRRRHSADRSAILWGATEIVQPHLSSADLQFLENRKFSRAEICAAFGVPEEIITATDHAKYDVMQGARLNFIENRIAPLCARLEAEEQVTVRAIDPHAVGWFDLESLPIMQQARRNRLVAAKTGFDMGIPFNELNRVLDLGFRPLPWGNQGFLPSNLCPMGPPLLQ